VLRYSLANKHKLAYFLTKGNLKIFKLKRWDFITQLIKKNSYSVGVEVGVAEGINFKKVLELNPNFTFYGVDPYTPIQEKYKSWDLSDWRTSLENFCNEKENAHLLCVTDEIAKDYFKENTVDLVFIDLDGSFEVTERNLRFWKSKLSKQGCVCGHDYTFCPEVKQALQQHTVKHFNFNDYWLVKAKDIK